MTKFDPQGKEPRPERTKDRGRRERRTSRAKEIESRRVITRQHSTARGASGRG